MKLLVLWFSFLSSICFADELVKQSVHVPALNGTIHITTNMSAPAQIHNFTKPFLFAENNFNPVADEIFDKIADDYVNYSQFLKTASIKSILQIRQSLLDFYNEPDKYSEASSRFDKFVTDFRVDTNEFDTFAFTSVDFLAQPLIGARDYLGPQLAGLRTSIIQSIPSTASTAQRKDFISFIDDLISTFPHGSNLGAYLSHT